MHQARGCTKYRTLSAAAVLQVSRACTSCRDQTRLGIYNQITGLLCTILAVDQAFNCILSIQGTASTATASKAHLISKKSIAVLAHSHNERLRHCRRAHRSGSGCKLDWRARSRQKPGCYCVCGQPGSSGALINEFLNLLSLLCRNPGNIAASEPAAAVAQAAAR
jgi:hypothetical protein